MVKLFYCKACDEDEGADISPYSRGAEAKATIELTAYIHHDGKMGGLLEDSYLDGKYFVPDSFTCHECEKPVQIVDIECPHDWRQELSRDTQRRCELCDIVQHGRAVFDA